ncbi:MAG TPA: ATP phosphoribosyltransferase regulatory subunit [Candidatus Dormibacteraeota bacterium]|jgi:ATP phosphoribosyltransferase regulatory subunit|nr:ATP phosphoribosyltransferase regulatory subunit [Candidatus Dormibacteraeota bacterium]
MKADPAGRGSTVAGFPDLLPEGAEAMRATQEAILAEMRAWGYRSVITPSVEALSVLGHGFHSDQLKRLFKFADSDGALLALVGERTVPVARIAAGPLRGSPLPLRLSYAGPVISQGSSGFTQRRETRQAGAELIGAGGAVADAEVLALAAACIEAAGLKRFQIDVGHAGFFQGLFDSLKLPAASKQAIKDSLIARDFVTLEALLDRTALASQEHELLLQFPALRGGSEILEAAGKLVRNQRSEDALWDLREVQDLLLAYGRRDSVNLDLGAIRDFDYYTGLIFESFGQDLGRPLASGGRYDRLLASFGRPAPATGFVVFLDLVIEAMAQAGSTPALPKLHVAVAWSEPGRIAAIRLGSSLRTFGVSAVVDTAPRLLPAAGRWSDEVGATHLVYCGEGDQVTWRPPSGRQRRLSPERAVAALVEG